MAGIALVIVDVQRDFLDPTTPAGVGSWHKTFCVRGVRQVLEWARSRHWRIVHIGTRHKDGTTLPYHQRRHSGRLYCEYGTSGSDFILSPIETEPVLYKSGYSAFFETQLEVLLADVKDVIFTGVATDCCIQQSVFDADRLGFRNIVPIQAVSASSCEAFVFSLLAISKSAGDVVDIKDLSSDRGISEACLDPEHLEGKARAWFKDQESLLETSTKLDLQGVLQHLASDVVLK